MAFDNALLYPTHFQQATDTTIWNEVTSEINDIEGTSRKTRSMQKLTEDESNTALL